MATVGYKAAPRDNLHVGKAPSILVGLLSS